MFNDLSAVSFRSLQFDLLRNELKKESREGTKEKYFTECEFKSILGCSCRVQFYLCGFPRPAHYWPLAYLFDGWLYDSISVQSVTEGRAARAQGTGPFPGYVFTGKHASARVSWIHKIMLSTQSSTGGGGSRTFHQTRPASSKNCSWKKGKNTYTTKILPFYFTGLISLPNTSSS